MLKINNSITTDRTKYKPSITYTKLKKHYSIFMGLFIYLITQNYKKPLRTDSEF